MHTGVVLGVELLNASSDEIPQFECHTIEGNVTSTGCIGGDRLARVRRMLWPAQGDRTIRWSALERRVTARLRRAALAADLEQEAAIMLWALDPTRFDESDQQYVRGMLFKRMRAVSREERCEGGGGLRVAS